MEQSHSERDDGAQNLDTPGYANKSGRRLNYRRPNGGTPDAIGSTIDRLLIQCANYCHQMK